jgi:antitoxin ParD1/3/4
MTSLTFSLPDDLQNFVDTQVSSGAFISGNDYVIFLLQRERLRALVLEGMNSGEGSELNENYFTDLYERIYGK